MIQLGRSTEGVEVVSEEDLTSLDLNIGRDFFPGSIGPGYSDPFPSNPVSNPTGDLPGGHNEWDNQIIYVCNLYGMTDALAPLYFKATIRHESGWIVDRVGDYALAGAGLNAAICRQPYRGLQRTVGYCSLGLCQVNRAAHPDLAQQYNLFNGAENILAGGQILAGAYHDWWPDFERVRAQYQGGPGGARAWPALAGWSSTQAGYLRSGVSAVVGSFRTYARAWGSVV